MLSIPFKNQKLSQPSQSSNQQTPLTIPINDRYRRIWGDIFVRQTTYFSSFSFGDMFSFQHNSDAKVFEPGGMWGIKPTKSTLDDPLSKALSRLRWRISLPNPCPINWHVNISQCYSAIPHSIVHCTPISYSRNMENSVLHWEKQYSKSYHLQWKTPEN